MTSFEKWVFGRVGPSEDDSSMGWVLSRLDPSSDGSFYLFNFLQFYIAHLRFGASFFLKATHINGCYRHLEGGADVGVHWLASVGGGYHSLNISRADAVATQAQLC